MCYLQILVWLFYKSRKDREVGAEITFLPGKQLNSSGLTSIEKLSWGHHIVIVKLLGNC